MNFEYFIAKRLIKGKEHKSSIASAIIKIAIVAITIGMVMMLITVATGVGLQRKIREKVAAFNGHVLIVNYDNNNSLETLIPIEKEQSFYPNVEEVKGVVHVQAVATKAGVIRTESDFEGIVLKGVGNDYNWDAFREYLVEGELPDFSDPRNNQVLMSRYTATRLGLGIGDKATTYFLKKNTTSNSKTNLRVFEIVGIYDSGFQQFDESFMIADIRHIQKMNKWSDKEIGRFEVFIEDFDKIETKGQEIRNSVPATLDSVTITSKYGSIFEWLRMFDMNIFGIIAIIILVAGINMITALLVLILERTPMIGLLKSLGADNWSIRKVFLYNAGYLILIGLFWGNIIGLGILFLQDVYGVIGLNPETYYVNKAPVYLDFFAIILLNIGTVLLCLLMLLVPSYIVARISPSKAIRFQ